MQLLDYIYALLVLWTTAVPELLFVQEPHLHNEDLALMFWHGIQSVTKPFARWLQLLICSRQPLSDHAFEFCRWRNCISFYNEILGTLALPALEVLLLGSRTNPDRRSARPPTSCYSSRGLKHKI